MYLLNFLVIILICVNSVVVAVPRVVQSFIDHEIVPDVLSVAPVEYLSVTFPDGVQALEGNVVFLDQVTEVPTVEWNSQPDRFYTLIFCDADAPSRATPTSRSVLHWLVGNIPGGDLAAGETLTTFINSQPRPGTGLHRYIFLIYEQPGLVEFNEEPIVSVEGRRYFSLEDFANKYNLGTPLSGNFYQTQNLEAEPEN